MYHDKAFERINHLRLDLPAYDEGENAETLAVNEVNTNSGLRLKLKPPQTKCHAKIQGQSHME